MPLIYYPNVIINGASSASLRERQLLVSASASLRVQRQDVAARGSHYLKFGAEYRYHVGIGIFPNLMNLNF